MLETLIPELAACGLQLNSAKTKILTTSALDTSEFVDVCGEMVQGIHAESVHKYLGRNLTGNFLARRDMEFAHRVPVAWNKFAKYKHILLNNQSINQTCMPVGSPFGRRRSAKTELICTIIYKRPQIFNVCKIE